MIGTDGHFQADSAHHRCFYPLYFLPPMLIGQAEADARSDAGLDTFALGIPPQFQGDLLAGRNPVIQINGDATRMSQAFTGERIHPVPSSTA